MAAGSESFEIGICEEEVAKAFCVSDQALGHGKSQDIADIIFVRHDMFDPKHTRDIAFEIGRMNGILQDEGRPYLLIGPGRWGSNDPWLGIPRITSYNVCYTKLLR